MKYETLQEFQSLLDEVKRLVKEAHRQNTDSRNPDVAEDPDLRETLRALDQVLDRSQALIYREKEKELLTFSSGERCYHCDEGIDTMPCTCMEGP